MFDFSGVPFLLTVLLGWFVLSLGFRFFLNKMKLNHRILRQIRSLIYPAITGTLITLLASECLLSLYERRLPRTARFIMPAEWAKHKISGTPDYYWQGHLHRYNSLKFRGDEWPKKRPDVLRIAVLGDSLTFGYGVPEKLAYPARIEKYLRARYKVEVFNLGHSGAQSEDIAWAARTFLPKLQPDIVLYGVWPKRSAM